MIPKAICAGTWLADSTDRERFLDAFASEKEKMDDLDNRVQSQGLVISESDPILFCAQFFAGLNQDIPLWLRAPRLSHDDEKKFLELFQQERERPRGALYIATGGTSCGLRFARHSWASIRSAALGLHGALEGKPLRS